MIVPDPLCDNEPVTPPGLDVAVYRVTTDPPLDAGAVNGTDAVVPITVTVPTVGASGTPAASTEIDAADAAEVPATLVAVTVKV